VVNDIITFVIILVLGLLVLNYSKNKHLPYGLFLLLIGISLGNFLQLTLPERFISIAAVLAAIMVVFDLAEKSKWRHMDSTSAEAASMSLVLLVASLIVVPLAMTFVLHIPFSLPTLLILFMMVFFLCETSSSDLVLHPYKILGKVQSLLEQESSIMPPFLILIPLILLGSFDGIVTLPLTELLILLFVSVSLSLGIGIIMGVLGVRYVKKTHKHVSLVLLCMALLTFLLAERIGGNGLLSVMAFGFFFGNVYLKRTYQLESFSPLLSQLLEIIVFVMLGMMIPLPSIKEVATALALFLLFTLLRYAVVSFYHKLPIKEKWYFALHAPKGSITIIILVLFILVFRFHLFIPAILSTFSVMFWIICFSLFSTWITGKKS